MTGSKIIELRWPEGVPDTEMSREFMQGMLDRTAVGFFKYGLMTDAAANGVDQIESARKRIERYLETGNTEWLIDVANMVLIEFKHPQHPEAHYRPTDSDESPGRALPPKTNVMGGVVKQGFSAVHSDEIG